jgi:hypothetical protein
VVVFFVVWIGSRLLFELPQKLLASINLGGSIIPSENAKLPKVLPVKNDHAPDPSKVSTPDPLIEDILSPSPAPVLSLPSPVKLLDDKVLMIIGGELYTNKGRLSVGSDFIFEGATETIKKIDVRLGMIFFESEKYLRVPK